MQVLHLVHNSSSLSKTHKRLSLSTIKLDKVFQRSSPAGHHEREAVASLSTSSTKVVRQPLSEVSPKRKLLPWHEARHMRRRLLSSSWPLLIKVTRGFGRLQLGGDWHLPWRAARDLGNATNERGLLGLVDRLQAAEIGGAEHQTGQKRRRRKKLSEQSQVSSHELRRSSIAFAVSTSGVVALRPSASSGIADRQTCSGYRIESRPDGRKQVRSNDAGPGSRFSPVQWQMIGRAPDCGFLRPSSKRLQLSYPSRIHMKVALRHHLIRECSWL